MIKNFFEKARCEHTQAIENSFLPAHLETLEQITHEMLRCLKQGRKILLCGNGGSAADAQHIAAELVGRFFKDRAALASIALTTDTSILTAVGNDYSYDDIFSRQVEALGKEGDILIGLSTSGNSKNVLKAFSIAKKMKIRTIGFTGLKGGLLKDSSDMHFAAQTTCTPHIQEVHITVLHAICDAVESILFPTESR